MSLSLFLTFSFLSCVPCSQCHVGVEINSNYSNYIYFNKSVLNERFFLVYAIHYQYPSLSVPFTFKFYLQFVPQDGREDFGANDEEEEDYDEEPAPRRGLDDEFDDEEDEDDEVDYDTFIIFICNQKYISFKV